MGADLVPIQTEILRRLNLAPVVTGDETGSRAAEGLGASRESGVIQSSPDVATGVDFFASRTPRAALAVTTVGQPIAITGTISGLRPVVYATAPLFANGAVSYTRHWIPGRDLAEVLAEPLIIRGGKRVSETTENVLTKLREQGWLVRIGMRCDGPDAIKAAVRQKMGVGITFADSIKLEIDSGDFKALKVDDFELESESFIVYPANRPLSPLAQEFLELLRDARTSELVETRSAKDILSAETPRTRSSGSPR